MSDAPSISVVIPTLGRRPDALARALECLRAQTAPGDRHEVIVVVDAAGPEELPAVGAARQLRASRPGASAARNCGWRSARADLVLFLDDDVLADPGLVTEHLAAHALDPALSTAVLGDVRWADELRRTPLMRWLDGGIQFHYGELADGADAGWGRFYTANVSVRRDLLEALEGFDEKRFPFGYEDLDFSLRAQQRGGLVVRYRRAASAQHLHNPTIEEWRTRVERIAVSERRFVERHPDVEPYFLGRFQAALAAPPARGVSAHLAGILPGWVPWLGPRARASAETVYAQDLARRFVAAWARAGEAPG